MKNIIELIKTVGQVLIGIIPLFRKKKRKAEKMNTEINGQKPSVVSNDTANGNNDIDMTIQENIFKIALSDGMPKVLAELIAAQAAHETGNFTSNVFRNCHNAFGYKALTPSVACDSSTAYKYYNSIEDSVHEVTAWIKRRVNEGKFPELTTITTPELYANALKSAHYFEDNVNNYITGLKRFFVNYLAPGGFLGFILFGLALWLLSKK